MFTFPWKFRTRRERQTDIDLQASEQRFRALFETMPDPAWIIRDHRFVEANAAALKAIGSEGKPAFLALHPADISPEFQPDGEASFDKAERIFQSMQTTPVQRFDWTHKHRDGHLFPVEVTLSRIEWDGQPALYCVWRDSSEREHLLDSLRTSEAYFHALFNGSGEAIMLVGRNGFIDCNPRTLELFGFSSKAEFLSMHPSDLSTPLQPDGQDSRAAADAHMGAAFDNKPQHFEWRHCRRDGTPFPAEVTLSAIDTNQGTVLHAIVLDVSERKRQESELQRYAKALDQVPALIYLKDRASRYVYGNRPVQMLFGCSLAELQGRDDTAFFPAETVEQILAADRLVLEHGKATSREISIRQADGSTTIFWEDKVPLFDPDQPGQIWGLCGISVDITEDRQQERQLRERTAQLQAANAAKSQFLAHMSHEIRTPMNAILGFAQVLAREDLMPEHRAMIQHINQSGRSLLGIINDILDFSKIEAGQLSLDIRPFHLASLLEQVESLLGALAREKGLALRIEAPPISGLLVGDALRLEQVLINLTGNAIKFTETGSVVIRVQPLNVSEDAVHLRFDVEDTGIGMADETQANLFQPFSQADSSITRRFGGTGLGLSISKRLVELMGGRIGVESALGVGSNFWFDVSFERLAEEEKSRTTPKEVSGPRLQGLRLLVVDDNQINLLLAEKALTREGAEVLLVQDGLQAIDCLKSEPSGFDLVLTDIQMPVMDGLTATRAIRRELKLESLPVIALTAGVLAEERQQALDAGINDFLPKPMDLDVMANMIRSYCPAKDK